MIALTFDDGPTEITPLVLDKLEKYNVTASFFLIGENITEETKPTLQRELDLRCEINNHSWSHPNMTTLTKEEVQMEIQKTNEKIYEMTGILPAFFRPPYIEVNDMMYETIAFPFICGIGCQDWDSSVGVQKRVETILNTVQDGDIILLHDCRENIFTVEALDILIPELLKRGYTFATVSQLFAEKGVCPDVTYKLWTNVGK
ncbi:polysaccharide deacetylase family protein [Anaeromicropila populeti]|uniref:Peptidoglycan/xylan/chitin deacetylase, PgdA/CDA1 family n=1 Tax=Anaeromicropila populeti TaxID=37658 RepID=A0A1I6HIY2_9FIRM|nr:polysaccharide deacetylase family protein [Anaeromicropila populeti]SFR54433.1 Peptidoglycan/xylan/chitin deacetylase, PgdA/CDA1 family [Anaeromicropila populeti]